MAPEIVKVGTSPSSIAQESIRQRSDTGSEVQHEYQRDNQRH